MLLYCTECKREVIVELVEGIEKPGKFYWKCRHCNNYVECIRDTKRPSGIIQDPELKQQVQKLKNKFEVIMKSKNVSRLKLCKIVSKQLGHPFYVNKIKSKEECAEILSIISQEA